MNARQTHELAKAKRMASLYSMVPNLLWSLLSLVPVFIFCYTQLSISLLFLFVGISTIPAFLPQSILHKMQVANHTATYKKLGVGMVLQLSQHGDLVNRMIRKKYPNYKALRTDRKSIQTLLAQTFVYEKFHYMLFLFFCLIGFYAMAKGWVVWAAGIFLINGWYNVGPILLQQYIRLKLGVHLPKSKSALPGARNGLAKYRLKCMG